MGRPAHKLAREAQMYHTEVLKNLSETFSHSLRFRFSLKTVCKTQWLGMYKEDRDAWLHARVRRRIGTQKRFGEQR